jgi:ELWxxDGT repeat protein
MLKPALSLLYLAFSLQAASVQAAAVPRLVADLNTAFTSSAGGISTPLLPLADKVVFSGGGIWRSDGTSLGTTLVSDLCRAGCSIDPSFFGTAGRLALFTFGAEDETAGLWRTDGTRQGTFGIKAGLVPCSLEEPQAAEIGGALVFPAYLDGFCDLWGSDGTAAGTRQLLPMATRLAEDPVRAGSKLFLLVPEDDRIGLWTTDGTSTIHMRSFPWNDRQPGLLTALGSRVFFLANGDAGNAGDRELWTSDGTPAGTKPVTQFAAPNPFLSTRFLKALDGVLYFVADDITAGGDLFRSDGTPAGTRRVTDFGYASPFSDHGASIGAEQIGKAGSRLFFLATDGLSGWRLWTSGGTPATTAPLTGCPGDCPAVSSSDRLVTMGPRLLFTGTDFPHGTEIWSTDGTGAGTRLLGDFCPGRCSSGPTDFIPLSGRLLFFAGAVGRGSILWTTDGAPQGTSELVTVGFSTFNSTPHPVTVAGKIFFTATDLYRGRQLWTSDGTPQGSGLVTLIGSGPGSYPAFLTAFGNSLAFSAYVDRERRLWQSDGTAAGTGLMPGPPRLPGDISGPSSLLQVGGLLFFLNPGDQLWRTDGSAAGTFQVSPPESRAGAPFAFQGKTVFTSTPIAGLTSFLWQTDGTVAGTRLLFAPPAGLTGFRDVRALGPRLYFPATTTSSIEQMWASDGTQAGTHPLTSFEDYAFSSFVPPEMEILGNTVYFAAAGRLWRTDGTMAGTSSVLPLSASSEGRGPANLTLFQGALYFIADTAQGKVGRGLWRSDGTAAGTVLVKAVGLPFDYYHLAASQLTPVGNQLFFVADDGDHGTELWRSDGTAAGTFLVRDIDPGLGTSRPGKLTAAGGRLYFSADDGLHGTELWQSDGTAAGTRMTQDLAPGGLSSRPEELMVAGHQLFFSADDDVHGIELWALDFAGAPGCQPSSEALCLGGGRYRVEASWRDFQGNTGRGHAASLTADTGTFWFFDPANIEAVVKILDGHGINGHDWVFYGALSTVEYNLTVTDTQTGAARLYRNPPGRLASVADTFAFGPQGATGAGTSLGPEGVPAPMIVAASRTSAKAGCVPSAARLCLQGGRFAVEVLHWRDFQNRTGIGTAVPLAGGDTGTFWFFDAANVELLVKVLDGRPFNGKFWVFYGALSNVEYTLKVTDTQTGKARTYSNPRGRLASVADTAAF